MTAAQRLKVSERIYTINSLHLVFSRP